MSTYPNGQRNLDNAWTAVGRGRQLANSQRTFKAIQGPGHTVGGPFYEIQATGILPRPDIMT